MKKNFFAFNSAGPGRILVSGSLAFDRVMDFAGKFSEHINPKKIHVINLSFTVSNLNLSLGGTAGNIAYNLSLLKTPATVIASLGRDGREYLFRLKALGVETGNIRLLPGRFTAGAYIITDRADNQISGFFSGAMTAPCILPKCKRGDWAIITADWPKNAIRLAAHYRKQMVPYIFDPGQSIPQFSASQLASAMKGAAITVGNDFETDLIFRKVGFRPRAEQVLITTLAAKGSRVNLGKRAWRIKSAKPTKTVDPTGAGDAYRAGLIKGLAMGYPIDKAAKLASTVAVYAVEKKGTQNHRFNWKSLSKRFKVNYKERL